MRAVQLVCSGCSASEVTQVCRLVDGRSGPSFAPDESAPNHTGISKASIGDSFLRTVEVRQAAHGRVKHLLNAIEHAGVAGSIGFRPTPDDERFLREAAQPGESTSDTLRRALRLLDHERWLTRFRAYAAALKDEDLNAEPDAW